ncbi:twin-arginine translocase TatA/TatE family subunit [Paenibacillus albus]|uniref:Sec-independent protein translocase protein TatA n=1 Tax=Paenibacillus albus TaxID=2495582 RepID=A0A3S9A0Z3_9BACL|nr:twin-arginine translocase TatA/TatE family subunit [Paenibacillus albus]AZN39391.1 twin-arginine translocase TatA/TatE family subunit [Paenibacillus albus]
MADIGTPGFILILIAALLLFGPKKLPELGHAFGRTIREFKSGMRDMMKDESNANAQTKAPESE